MILFSDLWARIGTPPLRTAMWFLSCNVDPQFSASRDRSSMSPTSCARPSISRDSRDGSLGDLALWLEFPFSSRSRILPRDTLYSRGPEFFLKAIASRAHLSFYMLRDGKITRLNISWPSRLPFRSVLASPLPLHSSFRSGFCSQSDLELHTFDSLS